MNIINESIKNESTELNLFLDTIQGCNYVVYGSIITFDYTGSIDLFNVDLIKKIYLKFEDQSDGVVKLFPWTQAFENINTNLSYTAYGEGKNHDNKSGLDVVSNIEWEKRKKMFWDIISNKFNLPPEKTYNYDNYFNSDIMWGFCYIFLKNGKGLVLHVGASD